MSDKDLGTQVTYLDPEGKSLETVVYRQDKPHSHAEANLVQDVQSQARADMLRGLMPSGFLSGDFLEDGISNYTFGTTANQFALNGSPLVHVNGWVIPIEYTNTTTAGENVINIDAPPVSTGVWELDFVYLEVWRALIDPNPATDNKPAADKLYRGGNVLSPVGVWIDDDLLDTPVAIANTIETTRRVQIQYAIRSTRLIDNTKRLGYDDTEVEAQGPNLAKVAGASFTASATDPGLWVAGDTIGSGNEIAGTVDGFVYSIPICVLFRRNQSAWDYLNNGNGGTTGVGTVTPSDRPDGLYADQIVAWDVQDLRSSTGPNAPDWERIMEKNVSLLLDNDLKSWLGNSAHTDFYVGGNDSFGTEYLKADDLLPSASADKPSGNTFRSPDGIATVFSDRAHVQTHVVEYSAVGSWAEDDTVTLDLTAGSVDAEQPIGTVITDVVVVRLNDSNGTDIVPVYPIKNVTGLGTKTVVVTLEDPPVAASSADIWVEYEITYPSASGLSSTVKGEVSNFDIIVHNPSAFDPLFTGSFTDDQTGRDALFPYLTVEFEVGPHREVKVKYRPDSTRTFNTFATTGTTVEIPEIPYLVDPSTPDPDITLTVNGNPKTVTGVSDDFRTLTFSGAETAGDAAIVEFTPHRPMPVNGAEMTLYYRANAIQAIPREYLTNASDPTNNELVIEPLFVPNYLYSGTVSSGSVGEAYPYESPLIQIPVNNDVGVEYQREGELNAPGLISIDDFDGGVGLLRLPTLVPLAFTGEMKLWDPVDVESHQSLEFIDHYTGTEVGEYIPSAFAQGLSTAVEHKTFMPMIARLKEDTDFGRAGTPVLVIFSQYYDFGSHLPASADVSENRITMSGDAGAASVYKIKGNFLSKIS